VLAVHLVALYLPRVDLGGAPQDSDKVVHVLLFGVPTFLGVVAFRRWWPAVLLALHAPLSEFLQATWLPGRTGDWRDALADLAGVAIGSVLALAVVRRPRPPEPPDATESVAEAAHAARSRSRLPGPEV
jgi:hypothetical protein